ncbi:MAG TPA: hypothetical protein ENN97_04055 [Phycisphaerales bacterium]|nr:hypothetical protein [Phycisphaerales bacterium]
MHTPPLETPVLNGIARKTVLDIAAEENVAVAETSLRIDDLLAAEEVFLTNVLMQVMPVTAVEAHTVADGQPGPTTRRLMERYEQRLKTTAS